MIFVSNYIVMYNLGITDMDTGYGTRHDSDTNDSTTSKKKDTDTA